MSAQYDMNVNFSALDNIEVDLKRIINDLTYSAEEMSFSIQHSQDFLAGNQFEKAKNITASCLDATEKTVNNIRFAIDYLYKLKSILEEYGQCCYKG